MAQLQQRVHRGRWRRLANLAADRTGSIHDDETARRMGFRGGFVPGSTVGTAAMPAIVAAFGERWMEGGWYTFKFVRPVYIDEEVREVAEPAGDGGAIGVRVEARDGRLCCDGSAGLGVEPPWQDGEAVPGGDDALPGIALDRSFPDGELLVTADDASPMLEAGGDETAWYVESSPWGGPLIPPERLMNAALQFARDGLATGEQVVNPGMWAEHALVVEQPMFLDEPYILSQRVAEKGQSGRTAFVTLEFAIHDAGGARRATGRHKIKWFLRSQAPS